MSQLLRWEVGILFPHGVTWPSLSAHKSCSGKLACGVAYLSSLTVIYLYWGLRADPNRDISPRKQNLMPRFCFCFYMQTIQPESYFYFKPLRLAQLRTGWLYGRAFCKMLSYWSKSNVYANRIYSSVGFLLKTRGLDLLDTVCECCSSLC